MEKRKVLLKEVITMLNVKNFKCATNLGIAIMLMIFAGVTANAKTVDASEKNTICIYNNTTDNSLIQPEWDPWMWNPFKWYSAGQVVCHKTKYDHGYVSVISTYTSDNISYTVCQTPMLHFSSSVHTYNLYIAGGNGKGGGYSWNVQPG